MEILDTEYSEPAERVDTWITEFGSAPKCVNHHTMQWKGSRFVHLNAITQKACCSKCLSTGRLAPCCWHCTQCGVAEFRCSKCHPHSWRQPMVGSILGIDQPHLGKARAFLIGSGRLEWKLDWDPNKPLDNPVSGHWFAAIREQETWYWWDTMRRRQKIVNLADFLTGATEFGRLYVFRDPLAPAPATETKKNSDSPLSIHSASARGAGSAHDPASLLQVPPPSFLHSPSSKVIAAPAAAAGEWNQDSPRSPQDITRHVDDAKSPATSAKQSQQNATEATAKSSQDGEIVSNSQGVPFCETLSDGYRCLVCGKKYNSVQSVRVHVFKYDCKKQLMGPARDTSAKKSTQ